MTRLLTTAIALPEHEVFQEQVRDAMGRWLTGRLPEAEKVLRMFSRSGVERRFLAVSLDDLFEPRPFATRNRAYVEHSVALAECATRSALESAGLPPQSIDFIATVSCTGFMIPAVDAHLANRLPLNPHVRRLPITELGCAGGAMSLSHAADYLLAYPKNSALVTAVELSSLNFQPDDLSMDHLVSCALFGDGAVSLVLAGEQSEAVARFPAAPRVVHRETCFFPDTLEAMGFRVESTGFHMVLDASIPALLREHLPLALESLVAGAGLTLADIDHFLIHPGGRKILDMVEELLGRGPDAVLYSRRALALYGNLSAASVLALLHEFQRDDAATPGDRAILVAFGPGFNAELILLEWPKC